MRTVFELPFLFLPFSFYFFLKKNDDFDTNFN